jgi:signal transduction histidine kinase
MYLFIYYIIYIGDSYRIEHLISNLLSNALKFSSDYGNIDIKIECGKSSDNNIDITNTNINNDPSSNIDNSTNNNNNYTNIHINDITTNPKSSLSGINCINKDTIKTVLTSAGQSISQLTQLPYNHHHKSPISVNNLNSNIIYNTDNNKKNVIPITVSITDEGPGISLENQRKLFNNFIQINPNQMQQGQGSGIYII